MHPRTALEQLISEVDKAFDSMRAVISAVDKVADSLKDYLSEETIEWIHKQMKRFKRLVADFSKKVYEALRWIGDPEYLRGVASIWSKSVANGAKKIRGDDEGAIAVYWSGQAATAYLGVERKQLSALKVLESNAADIGGGLDGIADDIDAFHRNLMTAFVVCGVAMVAGQGAIISVVGAPVGVSATGVALTSLVVAFAGLVIELESNLKNRLKDFDDIEIGKWPAATAPVDLSDGSVTDGNRSGWMYND
jgi:hypothetical protein